MYTDANTSCVAGTQRDYRHLFANALDFHSHFKWNVASSYTKLQEGFDWKTPQLYWCNYRLTKISDQFQWQIHHARRFKWTISVCIKKMTHRHNSEGLALECVWALDYDLSLKAKTVHQKHIFESMNKCKLEKWKACTHREFEPRAPGLYYHAVLYIITELLTLGNHQSSQFLYACLTWGTECFSLTPGSHFVCATSAPLYALEHLACS